MPLPAPGLGATVRAMREGHGWTQRQLGELTGREGQTATMFVSRIELETTKPENVSVLDLFQLAWALRVSPWALITGWEPDLLVDLDLPDAEPMPASMVWAWAAWDETSFDGFHDLDDGGAIDSWLIYSPYDQTGELHEPSELETIVEALADEVLSSEIVKALGRPRKVRTEDGDYEVSFTLDPETERGLRERLAVLINTPRSTDSKSKRKSR